MRALVVLTCAGLSLSLGAADPGPKSVRVRFRAIALETPLPEAAFVEGKQVRRCLIPSDFFSAEHTYTGDPQVAFGLVPRADTAENTEGSRRVRTLRARAASADFAYTTQMQAAAELSARAPEGPAGDSLRKQAEALRAEAEPWATSAQESLRAAEAAQRELDGQATGPTEAKRDEPKPEALRPLAVGTLTTDERQLLLFITSAGKMAILALPEPAADHPFGTLRFLNLGSTPLEITDGRRHLPLPPKSFALWRPSPDDLGYVGLEIRLPSSTGRPLRTIRTRPEADARTTYLVRWETGSPTATLKGVTERASPQPR